MIPTGCSVKKIGPGWDQCRPPYDWTTCSHPASCLREQAYMSGRSGPTVSVPMPSSPFLNGSGWLVLSNAVCSVAHGRGRGSRYGACTALAFSPENSCLASGDVAGRVRVCTVSGFKEVAALYQGRSAIHCLAFQRDPSQPDEPSGIHPWLLSAGDAGGTINIYQIASRRLKTICRGSHYDV